MDENKKVAILAIIIGGTSLLHNTAFFFIAGIPIWLMIGEFVPGNIYIFGYELESHYNVYSAITVIALAEAFTSWFVAMVTKREHLVFVTVSSCLLYVLIACYITMTNRALGCGWHEVLLVCVPHMTLYLIGIFFVNEIRNREKKYELSKTDDSCTDMENEM